MYKNVCRKGKHNFEDYENFLEALKFETKTNLLGKNDVKVDSLREKRIYKKIIE